MTQLGKPINYLTDRETVRQNIHEPWCFHCLGVFVSHESLHHHLMQGCPSEQLEVEVSLPPVGVIKARRTLFPLLPERRAG